MATNTFGEGNSGIQAGMVGNVQISNYNVAPSSSIGTSASWVSDLQVLKSSLLTHAEQPAKTSLWIPFSRNPDFVDRGNILHKIEQRCSEPSARVALVGLGGIG